MIRARGSPRGPLARSRVFLEKPGNYARSTNPRFATIGALSYQKTGESTKAAEALRQGESHHVKNETNRAIIELREEARLGASSREYSAPG